MRRVLSWVLAILLCMSLLPGAAWAEEGPADKKESVHDINRQWGVIDLIDHSREDADESADDLSADDGCGCAALAALAVGIHYVSVADGTGAWSFVSATLEGALQQTLGQGGSKGPAITAQPADATAAEGSTAEFSVTATGAASYQWQFWSVKSEAWYSVTATDYTGLTAATMTVPATADRNGMKYRCAVTNEAGTVYSESATLTVASKPEITAQPSNVTATAGSTAEFSVTATGAASYQWQYWSVKSEAWYSVTASDYTGLTAATMTVPATADRNGMKYRCAVTNDAGTVYSESATLTVG